MKISGYMRTTNNRGMSLLEIVIGSAIITVGILSLINAYNIYVKYALSHDKAVQATYLVEEGLEAMVLIRDGGWTSTIVPLNVATPHYLSFDGTSWVLGSTPEYVDGIFLRTVTIENVMRDSSSQIAESGTADPNTKKITVTVAFPHSEGTTTQSLSKYISNVYVD